MKLGIADRAVSGHAADRGRRLGELGRLRGAGDRLLAEILRPDPPLCRHRHIDVAETLRLARPRRSSPRWRRRTSRSPALGYYPNPLHPDPAHRETVIDHLKKVIVAAGRMGVPVVNTFCGGDASKHVDANWQDALKVWPDIVAHARDNGVKLAFENCPMIFSYDEWPGGHNIAYSPYVWRRILEAWGGDVGMNFDPSHLVWQMIDQARFIREFGPHMLHAHAKDLMIDRDGLYERGILSAGIGWQVPRMPGPRRGRLERRSSPASTAPAMTGRSSSSTRTGGSRAATSW